MDICLSSFCFFFVLRYPPKGQTWQQTQIAIVHVGMHKTDGLMRSSWHKDNRTNALLVQLHSCRISKQSVCPAQKAVCGWQFISN